MTTIRLRQHGVLKWLFAGSLALITLLCTLMIVERASAHGYVQSPGSRAYLCKTGANTNCGPIVYEPQSLEAPKGFPAAGPADGKIASANGAFPTLDEQSQARWSKVNLSPGTNTFSWTLTARHATTSWKYYITKQNWNPNTPLTRDSFDLTPFCSENYNGVQPGATYTSTCNVPSRTGYQVILAVWEIADTANAFYNVIDVDFGGGSGTPDTTAPSAPSSLKASAITSTGATLTWGASSDNVGVTSYKVYNGGTLVATTGGSVLSYQVTGLLPNTSYSFTVRAVDAAGNTSDASSAVTFTTSGTNPPDTQAPSAPTGLQVDGTPTSGTVKLKWAASTDNVGVTGYRVYNGSALAGTVSGTTLTYTASGLAADTSYTFTVRAVDAAGNESSASNAVTAKTASSSSAAAWAPNVAYTPGTLVTYNGATYECRQAHTSLTGWEPPNVPALWLLK
ncbi:lytic polysaccharide monooxygenase [Paenibacillus sp. VMFN-D1]|uniref:lytic polysaccharide monooxygenase n=1 Tax=Paenibacillus sp. VMFN-D1 TaxID=2135608 RepID=UPI000E249582|nr:lytic polysaccharide monooxygenase [Paenibacillus sp. VMFN-D1]RED40365.1 putative carbohydrate-binding protein with CBM5 and CBM33 domain [Paenibacillus sp. VMFN-D1]